ncbi:hypothetical protein [Enterobacter ludwigii]|uniref:hypothetical protein n=1 Tax=Enterobacter ludwigii TaxID=299767 RepID=UPI002893457F|nr:hypothetical protein [Enterobacter ludwigii]WNI83850.1 hypothetical protein RIK68_24680 [Enterobacter ludwigii]
MFFVLKDDIRNYIRNNPTALGVLAGFCRPNVEFDLMKLEDFQEAVKVTYMGMTSLGKRPRDEYPVGELGDVMHRDQNLIHEFTEYVLENLNYPLTSESVPDMVDEWINRIYNDKVVNGLLEQTSQFSREHDTRVLMYLAHNVR